MYEVKCELCGKILGTITDEGKILPVYRGRETAVFYRDGGYIDGSIPTSSGLCCTECSHSSKETVIENE